MPLVYVAQCVRNAVLFATARTISDPPTGDSLMIRKMCMLLALVLAVTGSVAFTVPSHAQVAARRAAVLLPRALPTASIAGPEKEEPRDIIEVRCSHGLVPWLAGIPA